MRGGVMKILLPIDSVVQLKGGQKRLMIYGRLQKQVAENKMWDYIGCLYPEGNIGPDYMYFFNHDQIERVHFTGFRDKEENQFQQRLKDVMESQS
jgi:hypothetical protein